MAASSTSTAADHEETSVAPPNLTREQAAERAGLLTVDNYLIELDLTDGTGQPGVETTLQPGVETFSSRTTVTFGGATPGASTFVDIVAARVHSATLNGSPVDVSNYDESTGITLTDLAERNELVVEADCAYSHTGEGLHRFVDPTDDAVYLYSQFETADAKRMFACFDQPDLKATFDVHVTSPADWKVISNSATVETVAPDAGRHIFRTTPKMSTYLVALIAGPYAEWTDNYSDEHGDIPLAIYCRASLGKHMDSERLFTETKQGFEFYHRNFGTPLRVREVRPAVRSRIQRGRNGERRRRDIPRGLRLPVQGDAGVVRAARRDRPARDGAHVFGDLVTMRWWDDLWLNESFATFAPCSARVRPPNTPTRGPRSPTSRSPGRTGRISCPPPTPSPPTSPTSPRSR